MPAFHSECRLSDGQWAIVRELDRRELADLAQALTAWQPGLDAM